MADQKVHHYSAYLVLVGGILGLMVAMGIGRFAYTPILPLMQRDLGMSNTLAGWLAGLNYLGYLIGAVLCSVTPRLLGMRLFTGSSLILCILTTTFMGLTLSAFWWGGLRLISGMTSAVLFVLISAEVGDVLRRHGLAHRMGMLYSGVGLGIALTGLLIPVLDHYWNWSGAWIGAGIAAALLAGAGILIGRQQGALTAPAVDTPINSKRTSVYPLALAYFFEGLGYVVSATFIVALIAATPGLLQLAPYPDLALAGTTFFCAHGFAGSLHPAGQRHPGECFFNLRYWSAVRCCQFRWHLHGDCRHNPCRRTAPHARRQSLDSRLFNRRLRGRSGSRTDSRRAPGRPARRLCPALAAGIGVRWCQPDCYCF